MSANTSNGFPGDGFGGYERPGAQSYRFGGREHEQTSAANTSSQGGGIRNPFVTGQVEPMKKTKGAGAPYSKVLATLPVLVSFPSVLLTCGLSVETASGLGYEISTLAAGVFTSGVLLLLVKLLVYGNLVSLNNTHSDPDTRTTVMMIVGIALMMKASNLIPVNRLAVLALGFYLDRSNKYTVLAFIIDVLFDFDRWGSLVVGYVLVFTSFRILSVKILSSSGCNTVASLRLDVMVGCLVVSLLVLMVSHHRVSVTMLGVNAFSSFILLLSLQNSDMRIPYFNSFVLNFVALAMEYVSFYTDVNLKLFFDLLLPLVIQVREPLALNYEPASSTNTSSSSIIKELMSHSDTRAIFNFLLLNTTFMFIQLLYSFRSKSLGLLSDSLHMALDCTSLALGLVAGILSKNEIDPNGKFPFGLKNFEILAGFTNGTLLIGISGSIIFEAMGRLWNPVVLQKTNELIVVSVLGLLVNLVGIFAFNHGHEGHSHGHSHGHSQGHSHGHSHSHCHTDSHGAAAEKCNEDENSKEMNDNMKGIFLHILADTLGSVGVVISTLFTKFFKWDGFDPVASIIIAVLIFLSAVPLIKSTASTLLLKLADSKEKKIRSMLKDITQVKGVKSFTTPRFWPNSENTLCGYVHIQVYRGENTSFIKKSCERIFEQEKVDVMIQIESDYDDCWCRTTTDL